MHSENERERNIHEENERNMHKKDRGESKEKKFI